MAELIALRKFGGEVPVLPPHLLPDSAAQESIHCDFGHGHLRPLLGPLYMTSMSNNPVRSIYTEDSISFYTWTTEAWPVKSPVRQDPYNRLYYVSGNVLTAASTAGMTATGGAPTGGIKVGVPPPTVAPGLSLVDLNAFPDYPSATWRLVNWWDDGIGRYQVQGDPVTTAVTLTTVTALRAYSFAPAARAAGTPAEAVLRCTLSLLDASQKVAMSLTLSAGEEVRSEALPGGVTATLTQVGTSAAYRIDLAYGIVETRAYTYTATNTWNEESGPSPAAQISPTYLQDVAVTLTTPAFTGYRPFQGFSLYRTMGSNAGYVRVRNTSATSFTDSSRKATDVLGSLDTLDYVLPPAVMTAIVALPGGVLAGFSGTTVYFCEPYRPHTWQYQVSLPHLVRGICSGPQALIVTTAAGCYAVLGSHPSAMQPIDTGAQQAGIAMRSMLKLEQGVAYASNDGIVLVSGSRASIEASQRLFGRDDWQSMFGDILADASIGFGFHDGRLVAVSNAQNKGLVLTLDALGAGMMTRYNLRMGGIFQLPVTDALYYAVNQQVYKFNADEAAPLTYSWWSKDFAFPRPVNLGAGYLRSSGTVTLTLYADGAQWWSGSVASGNFRLPPGRRAARWSVKLAGTAVVEELLIGRTMRELRSA